MTENNDPNLDGWDDFLGNWLKADVVPIVPAKVVVMNVRHEKTPDDTPQVVLTVNYNTKKFDFSLNKTNMKFIKEKAKLTPRQIVDKTLTLIKGKVYNPSTKQRMDSLFIDKVE